MKRTTISMSNAVVMTNSPTSRILACVVHSPRRLEDERSKSECYPTPPGILIYFPHNIPSRFMAMHIGRGGPCLVLLVNDGLDAIKEC
jgi:hypothetical protein